MLRQSDFTIEKHPFNEDTIISDCRLENALADYIFDFSTAIEFHLKGWIDNPYHDKTRAQYSLLSTLGYHIYYRGKKIRSSYRIAKEILAELEEIKPAE